MRCVGKDNAVCERMQCGDFIQAPHWLFRADILQAVEDILNGQRSTTAMGIEICFTHANPANPAKRIRQKNILSDER